MVGGGGSSTKGGGERVGSVTGGGISGVVRGWIGVGAGELGCCPGLSGIANQRGARSNCISIPVTDYFWTPFWAACCSFRRAVSGRSLASSTEREEWPCFIAPAGFSEVIDASDFIVLCDFM